MTTEDAIFAHIRGLDAKLDAKFEGLHAVLDAVAGRVASIDERLNLQGGEVHQAVEGLARTRVDVAVVETRVRDLDKRVASASRRMIALSSTATALLATALNQAWAHRDGLRAALAAIGIDP